MSVLSKALCSTVLVGVLSGCALNTAPSQNSGTDALASATGDNAKLDAASNAANNGASRGQVTSREQLSSSQSGLGIELERGQGFTRVLLNAKGKPEFDVMTVTTPPRLVLDLMGTEAGDSRSLNISNDSYLKAIRVGKHADRSRIVFDLTQLGADQSKIDQLVDEKDGRISVTFAPLITAAADLTPAPAKKVEIAEQKINVVEPKEAVEAVAATSPAAEAKSETAVLSSLNFSRSQGTSGSVTLGMDKPGDFRLQRTTPTEYALTITDATAAERTLLPQISPRGTASGIRSARAVNGNGDVTVRMFVDSGVDLVAKAEGSNIVVKSVPSATAKLEQPYARAQLEKKDEKKEEKGAGAAAKSGDADDAARQNPTGSKTVDSADGSKQYHGRLISLDLQDTDIDNALRIIAEVSGLNIIASEEVTGKVTLRLIDVPWDQALDVILKTNGLDQVTEGSVVRIAPVDKLRQEREALLEAKRAATALEDLKVSYVRVSYARVADLKEQVEAVLSERGSVTVDERTNQLIIKDIRSGQDESEALIKKLDLRTPQVLLETEIVEAQRGILRDLGFQWNYSYNASPETGNATGAVFPNSVNVGGSLPDNAGAVSFPAAVTANSGSAITALLDSADGSRALSARISALETEGRVKVISRPQVATVNNKQAEIKSVETIRVKLPDSGTSVATGAGASASGGGSSAVEKIDVGIELRVTPQASPDYYVLLDINAKSSTFGERDVDGIPSTLEREATSTILVKSGQTFALGGVYRIRDRDSLSGVPWLKDIPVLGTVFRRTLVDKSDEELIFFITPHIVEGSFDQGLMNVKS